MRVVLTVADHEKNGFVSLVGWPEMTEEAARQFIGEVDARPDPDSVLYRCLPLATRPALAQEGGRSDDA